jgi:hypothetical protein
MWKMDPKAMFTKSEPIYEILSPFVTPDKQCRVIRHTLSCIYFLNQNCYWLLTGNLGFNFPMSDGKSRAALCKRVCL